MQIQKYIRKLRKTSSSVPQHTCAPSTHNTTKYTKRAAKPHNTTKYRNAASNTEHNGNVSGEPNK